MSILLILNRLTQRHNVMYFERERETYRDVCAGYCVLYQKRNTCYSIGIHAIIELIEYLMYLSHINFEKNCRLTCLSKVFNIYLI